MGVHVLVIVPRRPLHRERFDALPIEQRQRAHRDPLQRLDALLGLKHRGPNVIACDASFRKGDEMGWFQHGSTIIVFAPDGFSLHENVRENAVIRVGEPLMRLP